MTAAPAAAPAAMDSAAARNAGRRRRRSAPDVSSGSARARARVTARSGPDALADTVADVTDKSHQPVTPHRQLLGSMESQPSATVAAARPRCMLFVLSHEILTYIFTKLDSRTKLTTLVSQTNLANIYALQVVCAARDFVVFFAALRVEC